MELYQRLHCFPANGKLQKEGNVLILSSEYVAEEEHKSHQLWLALDKSGNTITAKSLQTGEVKQHKESHFYGIAMKSKLTTEDCSKLEEAHGDITKHQKEYWNAESFSPDGKSNFRSLTELDGIVLACQCGSNGALTYSIWTRKKNVYSLEQEWLESREKAELDFSIRSGLMNVEDLPTKGEM